MPPTHPDKTIWYEKHLKPHEAMLGAWLRSRFSSIDDVEDVMQESLMRVLNSNNIHLIQSPKAFLFATARNIVLMRFRKNKVRKEVSLSDFDSEIDPVDDEKRVSENVSRNEELELLTKAIQSLPTRCRQVLTLRKIYGLSQKEIAKQLGISENTVEAQGSIGMRKITKYFKSYQALGSKG